MTPWSDEDPALEYAVLAQPLIGSLPDADLKADVVDKVRAAVDGVPADLEVDVRDGLVVVSGTIGSWSGKQAVSEAVRSTPGVVDVRNELCPTT
nr:BON domain-containing protein [Motilibacter deserti]